MTDAERQDPTGGGEFGAMLSRLRQERRLTQKALAALAHCTPSTISRVESGERGVSRELVDALAEALSVTAQTRIELLQAAGLIGDETAALLESPAVTRLSRLLALPNMRPDDRARLLQYVELALAHADALGYLIPEAWPDSEHYAPAPDS